MPVFIGQWGVGGKSRHAVMNCNNIRRFGTLVSTRSTPEPRRPIGLFKAIKRPAFA
jgi:hypothetical protein